MAATLFKNLQMGRRLRRLSPASAANNAANERGLAAALVAPSRLGFSWPAHLDQIPLELLLTATPRTTDALRVLCLETTATT